MANHGPFCKRIKNDKENILKLTMWKRQRMLNGGFIKSLSISPDDVTELMITVQSRLEQRLNSTLNSEQIHQMDLQELPY